MRVALFMNELQRTKWKMENVKYNFFFILHFLSSNGKRIICIRLQKRRVSLFLVWNNYDQTEAHFLLSFSSFPKFLRSQLKVYHFGGLTVYGGKKWTKTVANLVQKGWSDLMRIQKWNFIAWVKKKLFVLDASISQ